MGGHDFIQERKEELMDGWLYGGVVPAGEKKLGDVAELLLGNPDDDDGIKRERERERERGRERERERKRKRKRKRDRDRERDRERARVSDRERETHTEREMIHIDSKHSQKRGTVSI